MRVGTVDGLSDQDGASSKTGWRRLLPTTHGRAARASSRGRKKRCLSPRRARHRRMGARAGRWQLLGRRDGAPDAARRISRETMRRRLAENDLKPWQQKMWCIPKVDAEYVARMEDVLDLYAEAARAEHGRSSASTNRRAQLIGEVRARRRGRAGPAGAYRLRVPPQRHRQPLRVPRRASAVADTSRSPSAGRHVDFAECMRDLVDVHYPQRRADPRRPRQPLDPHARPRSTKPSRRRRRAGSCAASSSTTCRSTPAGSTWSRSRSACSSPSASTVGSATDRPRQGDSRWTHARNAAGAKVRWMFAIDHAREKLGRAYPQPLIALAPLPREPVRFPATGDRWARAKRGNPTTDPVCSRKPRLRRGATSPSTSVPDR